jgi:choline-sulfatase
MRFAFLPLLLAGCHASAEPPAPLRFPDHNVVFVSFDALQAAHVGHLGYARNTTPALDAMANDGVTFTHATSVASWTVPASMSWFTGVFPSEHKMVNKFAVYTPQLKKPANLKDLSPDLVTLADVFKANGYATGGFTGNAGVSGGFGYEQGFDVYLHEKNKFGGFDYSIPKALEWLAANKDKKFFLFLHGYDAHGQNTPAKYDYRFVAKDYDYKFLGTEAEQEALREEGLDRGRANIRDADVKFWRAAYDEKVQRADVRFKDFLAEFEKLGVTGKTVFVLTADHGTELHEHARFDHGFTLYEELIRVPLVFKLPGGARGVRITDRVSSIDVMPTVLDLLGLQVADKTRKQMRGASLVPAMRGERVRRDCFSETDYRAYTYKRSVVTPDGWKLIYTLENKTRELFDVNADPGETNNLSAKEKGRADALERAVFAHFKAIGHDLTARRWEVGLNPVYASQGK